jgi:SP family galactose:H+ symporter-like MFS transporter
MSNPSTPRKISFVVYFIGFTAALAGLLFGLDVGVISGTLGFIKKDFLSELNPLQADSRAEFIVSALLWGAVAGTLISVFSPQNSGAGRRFW